MALLAAATISSMWTRSSACGIGTLSAFALLAVLLSSVSLSYVSAMELALANSLRIMARRHRMKVIPMSEGRKEYPE